MKIIYIIEKDISFPIVEGLRKEVFLYAEKIKKKKSGYEVEIFNLNKKESITKEGVKIVSKNIFNIYFAKADIIHYFGQPSPLLSLILLLSKYKKFYINIVDGDAGHFWTSIFSMTSIRLINKKVTKIYIQTKYQYNFIKKYLNIEKINFLSPLIPEFKQKYKKSKNPRLFFMGHFSEYKGIYEQLDAYKKILAVDKNVEFVIANSGLNKKTSKVLDVIKEINNNGGNIILKGKIDPEEELSKSWIYLYTYKKSHNTFAVPLSLYEANLCNTFFITGNIGGNNEYFNEKYLIKTINSEEIFQNIKYILENYNQLNTNNQLKIKIDNNEIINEIIKEYEK